MMGGLDTSILSVLLRVNKHCCQWKLLRVRSRKLLRLKRFRCTLTRNFVTRDVKVSIGDHGNLHVSGHAKLRASKPPY